MFVHKQYKFRCPRDARIRSNVFAAEEYVRVLTTSVHGLEMPVGECPCIARGARQFVVRVMFCLLHICKCTTNLL